MIVKFTNGFSYNTQDKEHKARDLAGRIWDIHKQINGDSYFAICGYGMGTIQEKLEIKEVIEDGE